MTIQNEIALMNRPIGAFGLPIVSYVDLDCVGDEVVTVRPASYSGWLVFFGVHFVAKLPTREEAGEFAGQILV